MNKNCGNCYPEIIKIDLPRIPENASDEAIFQEAQVRLVDMGYDPARYENGGHDGNHVYCWLIEDKNNE